MGLRNLLRSWLGVPSEKEVRDMILREVDADAVREAPEAGKCFTAQRKCRAARRYVDIAWGRREDTRV